MVCACACIDEISPSLARLVTEDTRAQSAYSSAMTALCEGTCVKVGCDCTPRSGTPAAAGGESLPDAGAGHCPVVQILAIVGSSPDGWDLPGSAWLLGISDW